jgi:hypothetical protein
MTNSNRLIWGGFLGTDPRPLADIIAEDALALRHRGLTPMEIAGRMRILTNAAVSRLGTPISIGNLEITVDDHRGILACPWSHPGRILKRNTQVLDLSTGKTLRWTDLSIHLIGHHGFFQGRGSPFRLEPADLAAQVK